MRVDVPCQPLRNLNQTLTQSGTGWESMTLNQWRIKKGYSYRLLAKMVGASHASVVRRWCLGMDDEDFMIPKPKYMLQILELTAGEVQPNDFYIKREF